MQNPGLPRPRPKAAIPSAASTNTRQPQVCSPLDHLPVMIWSALPDGSQDYRNHCWSEFTGARDSVLSDEWITSLHPDDQERARTLWARSLLEGKPFEGEHRLRHWSGDYRWVLGRAWPERDESQTIVRWYGTCTDIHELVTARNALSESLIFQESILDSSTDCIKVLSLDGRLEFMNNPGCAAMELSRFDDVKGEIWPMLWPLEARRAVAAAVEAAARGDIARFTGACPTAAGNPKYWDVVVSPILDPTGRVTRLLSISRDITAHRATSDQLRWASEHDALTGLPNRRSFQANLQAATLRSMQASSVTGLLLIDLDHFKLVNDSLGHAAGDHLLKTVAHRLASATGESHFVSRLGGDEFAIILENVRDTEDLVATGSSILDQLKAPIRFDGRVISASASIGGALFPRDAATAHELFKHADTALHALKSAGRGGTKMFHSHMREEAQRAASQLSLARIALSEQSMAPMYQPKVLLRTGATIGFEALLRWRHPTRGLQEPESVLEAFKDYELASKIGDLMQRRAFADLAEWRRCGTEIGHLSINAAPAEFLRDDYAERFLERLDEYRLPPQLLEVEVTEHVFLDRSSQYVERALRALKQAGVRIALDDFGTGHSSLSHLRDFPVDVVKIDRSFVQQIVDDREIEAIVKAVLDLCQSLAIKVIAEGIETVEQLNVLRSHGCEFGQGWLFGKGAAAAEISRHRLWAA